MKLLFLRGHVPFDRPARQIMFDRLRDCDDLWTQLAAALVYEGDYGEIWYEKGNRVARYRSNFIERWVPRIHKVRPSFTPDVLFVRGGFDYQVAEARRQKTAFRIYYGAGERTVPRRGQPWDLVLVDTLQQHDRARAHGYRAELWRKPAAENIFHPATVDVPKKYDVIYVANYNPNAYKGHDFLLSRLAGHRVLQLGEFRGGWAKRFPYVEFVGRRPRKLFPGFYGQAKIALIMTRGKDSAPRVLPEALACNCPILVSMGTKIARDAYITPETGRSFTRDDFREALADILARWNSFSPRRYYDAQLSMARAVSFIRESIR